MGPGRSFRLRGGRRGNGRAALLLFVLALLAAGCGGDEGGASDAEDASDVEMLNAALARESTILDVYTRGRPALGGEMAAAARRFRAHQLEYISALTKTVRGLGGEMDFEAEELDLTEAKNQADFLTLAYELESAALDSYVEATTRLFTDAPRTLATSLAAGHAQHLVVLRQGLGESLANAVPEAFDGGEVPAPGAETSPGEG